MSDDALDDAVVTIQMLAVRLRNLEAAAREVVKAATDEYIGRNAKENRLRSVNRAVAGLRAVIGDR